MPSNHFDFEKNLYTSSNRNLLPLGRYTPSHYSPCLGNPGSTPVVEVTKINFVHNSIKIIESKNKK